jgi:hypothetical protein
VSEDAEAQWPHADTLNGGQGAVALQDHTPSTLVYGGSYTSGALADQLYTTAVERSVRSAELHAHGELIQGLTHAQFLDAIATPACLEGAQKTE